MLANGGNGIVFKTPNEMRMQGVRSMNLTTTDHSKVAIASSSTAWPTPVRFADVCG